LHKNLFPGKLLSAVKYFDFAKKFRNYSSKDYFAVQEPFDFLVLSEFISGAKGCVKFGYVCVAMLSM
jgi:hypothetical protein